MNKKIIIGTVIVLVVGIVGFVMQKGSYQNAPTPSMTNDPSTQYALADVAKHATPTSCWTAIGGKVYDLTAWIAEHPGGEQAILGTCGIDATKAFTEQHGGERRPENELAKYAIGVIVK